MKLSINIILVLLMILFSQISYSYEINIYDSVSYSKSVVIEVIDDCKFSHKLLISLENSKTDKVTDWMELLFISKEWNKCIDN